MRFARIERDDYALVREIDFYILHPRNVLQQRSQFAHAFIAIFTFRANLDRFQNSLVGTFRKKESAGSGSVGRARPYCLIVFYLTSQARAVVASLL